MKRKGETTTTPQHSSVGARAGKLARERVSGRHHRCRRTRARAAAWAEGAPRTCGLALPRRRWSVLGEGRCEQCTGRELDYPILKFSTVSAQDHSGGDSLSLQTQIRISNGSDEPVVLGKSSGGLHGCVCVGVTRLAHRSAQIPRSLTSRCRVPMLCVLRGFVCVGVLRLAYLLAVSACCARSLSRSAAVVFCVAVLVLASCGVLTAWHRFRVL